MIFGVFVSITHTLQFIKITTSERNAINRTAFIEHLHYKKKKQIKFQRTSKNRHK